MLDKFKSSDLLLVDTPDLLDTVTMKIETIGEGAQMAGAAIIELLAMQPFEGTYATTSADGKDMILVGHIVEDETKVFTVNRYDLAGFTADAVAA